jgi:hypothetical protein
MPWYYAGPEAKPVGPVSAEQLQALQASGTITPETFVIEHTGAGAMNLAWKRYRDAFPAGTSLPPIPTAPAAPHPTTIPSIVAPPAPAVPIPGSIPAPIPSSPAPAAAHPLFPSATGHAGQPPYGSVAHPAGHPPIRPTNSWCAWGLALAVISFFPFSCVCIGAITAPIAAVLCIIGLVQVNKNHAQGGQGLAITGLIFSGVALLIAIILIGCFGPTILKAHGLTVTEQTSNDSE